MCTDGGRRHCVGSIPSVKRHGGHFRRHARHRESDRIGDTSAGVGAAIDEGKACLIELFVDCWQGSKEPFVVGWIGGVAHADERAVDRKKSSTAASLHRLASHLHVGWAEIFIDGRHLAVVNRRLFAAVASDCGNRLTGCRCPVLSTHASRFQLFIGKDTDQGQISLEIPRHHLSGQALGCVGTKEIHFDASLSI